MPKHKNTEGARIEYMNSRQLGLIYPATSLQSSEYRKRRGANYHADDTKMRPYAQ